MLALECLLGELLGQRGHDEVGHAQRRRHELGDVDGEAAEGTRPLLGSLDGLLGGLEE